MDTKTVAAIWQDRKGQPLERVICVDPGLGGTGWALFESISTGDKKLEAPVLTGVIEAPRNEKWDNRVWSVCSSFGGVLASAMTANVVIEFPVLFSGHAKSQSSAARGDLFKLTYLVGGIAQVARQATGNLPILITPSEWKGQLPKDVVIARIKKAYGKKADEFTKDHEADAVGMGLALQGRL